MIHKMNKKFILVGAKPSEKPSPNPGGQLTASLGLIEYAKSKGYEVNVIDTTQSSFPVPPIKQRIFRGWGRVKLLWSMLRMGGVSGVIIFSSSGFSFYERIFLSGICRILHVPDLFFIRSGHFYNQINSSFFKRSITKILIKVPGIIGAQGHDWVKFYKSIGVNEKRIVLVRNWVSKKIKINKKPISCDSGDVIKFVFVGWLVKEKGVRELLDAALSLSKKHKFVLQIIGGGTLENYCRDFVELNQLHNYILINGWQKHDVVLNTLKSSHVFILPSEAEGFPNALLESMALGLPGICTRVGGVSDSLVNGINGFLLESNRIGEVTNAMNSYLDNPELINQHSIQTIRIFKELHNREENCQLIFDNLLSFNE